MSSLSTLPGATPMPTFTYLYLPTDDTKPVEEHTLQFTSKSEVGCLISHLSERFAMVAPKSEEAANSMAELLKTEAQRKGIDVSSLKDALGGLSRSQMVDVVTLLEGGLTQHTTRTCQGRGNPVHRNSPTLPPCDAQARGRMTGLPCPFTATTAPPPRVCR